MSSVILVVRDCSHFMSQERNKFSEDKSSDTAAAGRPGD